MPEDSDGDQHRLPAWAEHGDWKEARDSTSYGLGLGLSNNGYTVAASGIWEVLSACTTFLPALTYSHTSQLHHFLGAEVWTGHSLWQRAWVQRQKKKGYLERSGQELEMVLGD